MRLTAKIIVLDLLSAGGERGMSARELIGACRLFEENENSVRVALARLVAEGAIEAASRGMDELGVGAQELARQVVAWRDAERRLRKWDGGWVCVAAGAMPRSDRSALRRRERALKMIGLQEL